MILRRSFGEKCFDKFNIVFMIILMLITIYPMIYVLFASISDPIRLMVHDGALWKPLGFTLKGYELVLKNPNMIIGYRNSALYLFAGTAINLFMTSLGAYILSRKKFLLKKFFMVMVIITMYFNGGMIPRFLVVQGLGMTNTIWSMLLPCAMSTWNLIILRTAFMGIPSEIEESAKIDGANDFVILFRIILRLTVPVVAVLALLYGVYHWNAWFDAMVFIRDRRIFPLQLFLREILIQNETTDISLSFSSEEESLSELVRYCTIIVAIAPIICVYPFLQRYFVKGIMIGALKG